MACPLNRMKYPNKSKVGAFYDSYPYPSDPIKSGPPSDFKWYWSFENIYSFCVGRLPIINPDKSEFSILDAGCGTGLSTLYLAAQNPQAKIIAVDVSSEALLLAKDRFAKSGLEGRVDVSFENIDFFSLNTLLKFNFINSVGVLPHVSEQSLAIKFLGSLLKDSGIINLVVYAENGRREVNSIKKILQLFGLENNLQDLHKARKIIEDLPNDNFLKVDYKNRDDETIMSNSQFADIYMHPFENTLKVNQLFELIDASGLHFLSFYDNLKWDVNRFFSGNLLDAAYQLPFEKQCQLVEELDPSIDYFRLFLSNRPSQRTLLNDDQLLCSRFKINPSFHLGLKTNFDKSEITNFDITSEHLEFIGILRSNPGKALKSLPFCWEESYTASISRELYRNNVLLLYP